MLVLAGFSWGLACLGVVVVGLWLFVRYIPHDRVGILEKGFSRKGSVESGLIALEGEAGFQPEVLRGGLHVLNRLQCKELPPTSPLHGKASTPGRKVAEAPSTCYAGVR